MAVSYKKLFHVLVDREILIVQLQKRRWRHTVQHINKDQEAAMCPGN